MGCFLGCFKGSKDRKRSRKPKKSFPAAKVRRIPVLVSFISSRENQEQGAVANVRKKVTFDLNVTTFESATVHGDTNEFWEDDAFERNVKEQNSDKEEEKGKEELTDALKSVTYPPNHRYQNCESSDDEGLCEEDENEEDKEIDFYEDNDSGCEAEEESYDSYFSLPMENQVLHFQEVSSPKPTGEAAAERELLVLSKGNVRDRSKYIHSVMNPVENSSHWKEVKVRRASLKNPNKENINESQTFIIPEPTMKPKKLVTTNTNPDDFAKQEITVDASLSNWLIFPNYARISPVSQEERPILGSLDMEDFQHSARTSSPRKSPSRSSVEIPIIRTVGGYLSSRSKEGSPSSWSSSGSEKRGIPNTTSKYREDKRVSWYCTPFETRLEKALELEPTGTCSNVESTT
ncbi:hypothetical protein KSP40_PGU008906 [Platanthera guangdongensis]|uniref:Uncharacterized protein n=1 Tax=Platanthera guangdongensis TaxID=2320717 RepID=A0ABR2MRN7_9ASPA